VNKTSTDINKNTQKENRNTRTTYERCRSAYTTLKSQQELSPHNKNKHKDPKYIMCKKL